MQHLLDLIPELKAAAALKRENGEPVKEEKKKENDEEEEEDEQEQAMAGPRNGARSGGSTDASGEGHQDLDL